MNFSLKCFIKKSNAEWDPAELPRDTGCTPQFERGLNASQFLINTSNTKVQQPIDYIYIYLFSTLFG